MSKLRKKFFSSLLALKRKRWGPPRKLSAFDPSSVRRILVVSCTAMGDTLLSVPAIRAVRQNFPQAHLTWLISPRFAPLFRPYLGGLVDQFLFYRGRYRGLWSLLRQFQAHQFQVALSFHDSDYVPVGLAYLSRVPFILRSALKDAPFAPYLSERIPYRDEAHAVEQRLDVVRALLRSQGPFDPRLYLPVSEEQFAQAQVLLRQNVGSANPLIGFQCCASRPYREWPLDRFAALAEAIKERYPQAKIILFGSSKDRSRLESLRREGIVNLAGKIPLELLGAVLKSLALLVSVDTGPMHVAFAVNTPTVCLFVPSEVRHTGPYQDFHLHHVVLKPRPCQPCKRKYCPSPWCMELIEVEEVLEKVIKVLG